eukprot:TRINITY_DN37_c0_g1_i3.p1 TRINITY_DN37_c0_g1~~TRINITY_DN37_c0_g1_i3.p1  ORF type:complete len:740 (+),score=187.74 TRINITY_DN37_c0_g1_i3:92-2311(+)
MKLHFLGLTLLLCMGLAGAQEEKRLRLRRPRPFKDIDNVDGIAKGRPVPLKVGRADPSHLLASAFEGQETQQRSQQASRALESLLATAGRSSAPARGVLPQEGAFEEVAFNQRSQIPRQREPVFPQEEPARRPSRPRGRTRLPPQIPRRDSETAKEVTKKFKPRKPSIKTTERYSHENEDGSFTFGYVSEDGSFREETRGVDCITRGKYGYIDPEGKKREFTYVSGLPCDTPEEGLATEDEDSLQRIQDPVNPAERFRTSNPIQVSESDLPASFIRNRQRVRRPQSPQASGQNEATQSFPSFNRERTRPPTQAPTRRPIAPSGALNNLFAIADEKPTEDLAPRRPVTPVTRRPPPPTQRPTPFPFTPSRIASPTPSRSPAPPAPTRRPAQPTPSRQPAQPTPSRRPAQPTPTRRPAQPTPTRRPAQPTPSRRPVPQGSFDFQKQLADFDNRRPSITFDQQQKLSQQVGPNFSSELSFNPESGTFQTDLRQSFGGQEELRLSQPNAPSGQAQPFASPTPPAFSSFASTTARPAESPSLSFQPLEFPDPSTVKLSEPPASAPEKSVFFQPFPSSTAAPPPSVQSTTRRPPPPTAFPATPTATPVRSLPPATPPRQSRPPLPPPPQPFIQQQFNVQRQQQTQPPRAQPFTAFASGTPPQLSGGPPTASFGGPPSIQFAPQPQPRPAGFNNNNNQFRSFPPQQGARFLGNPAGRPAPPPQQSAAASAAFTVFNPAAFAGIRGA